MTPETDPLKWRYTRLGSVLLSYDFYLGVPLGIIAGFGIAISSAARNGAPGLLIGVAGVSAAIAALVLTALTVLLTTLSKEYRHYLTLVPGGVGGVAGPYKMVVAIAAAGTTLGMIGSFAMPVVANQLVVEKLNLWAWHLDGFHVHLGAWLAAAPGIACCLWATIGCVQLTGQLLFHWEWSLRAEDIESRRAAATKNAG